MAQLLPAASSSGDLPLDALVDILLRIPAKDLCRLRAVSPSWRALTCDPLFIAEHKSRHTAPLLAVAYRDQDMAIGVDVLDLSGNIVKRIQSIEGDILVKEYSVDEFPTILKMRDTVSVLSTHLDLVCFTRGLHPLGLWVVNPATGTTLVLPECYSEELARDEDIRKKHPVEVGSWSLGQVSSTGEYKVMRIVSVGDRQMCEVITLDGADHGRWRGKQNPPSPIFASPSRGTRSAIVDGVVYFMMNLYRNSGAMSVQPGSIAPFNLETEEWMGTLRGPAPIRMFLQDHAALGLGHIDLQLSLAELDSSLVTVRNNYEISMELWFLIDFENAIWEKKYNIPSHVGDLYHVYPFLELPHGRILFSHEDLLDDLLKSYDPKTGIYTNALEVRDCRSIAIFTGSLLRL